jgi:hypothetical protein
MSDNGILKSLTNTIDVELDNDDNARQAIQAKLNKTTKFSRKPGTANINSELGNPGSNLSNPGMNRFDGHSYTVSINFNRPQQSKGHRMKGKITLLHPSNFVLGMATKVPNQKKAWIQNNNFFRAGAGFDSPKDKKNEDNIYDYDIETNGYINRGGYIDVESSTRKRPSKTAGGK